MTLAELIAKVNHLRPSQYDKYDLTAWVNEIEFRVVDEVINRSLFMNHPYETYNYDEDCDKVLLIPDQFSEVYETYLFAKIDYSNAEIDRYNMDVAMADAAWDSYASWYRRHHYPKPITGL